ncbi:GAF domain-containing protein [Streptomyces sp. BE133]|uniref:GAF domain-containing protein n=1 Tax=Streptomyces sp. BE133 TaxID=3002523 RepID=UPI002E7836B3|nr:hypothetical protein [Streptomyces sp. BE133]MEE1805451.1 hypothetical protein [Streptomyces sp. BE133]
MAETAPPEPGSHFEAPSPGPSSPALGSPGPSCPGPAAWPQPSRPDRMRSLLDAVMSLGRGLELPEVLRGIVEAAVTLTDAEYGALGIVGDGQKLLEFLPVGLTPRSGSSAPPSSICARRTVRAAAGCGTG